MFYNPQTETSGLPYNPFKSCCVPRPIGWVSTISVSGVHNLAPYSQFQNLTWDPPTVMIAANNRANGDLKDTTANILSTGEFVWNMATWAQRNLVFASAHVYPSEVDEFEEIGIDYEPARNVKPRRVAGSPVQFECRLTQKMEFPGNTPEAAGCILVAQVVGIHIADHALLNDGLIDIARIKPLARLGYRDYTCVERVFNMSEFDDRALSDSVHNLEVRRP